MDSVDLQVLTAAYSWWRDGHRVVLGTVVRTWGSAPRPVGALVALREDGQIVGSVSGGCIEDDLMEKTRAGLLFNEVPKQCTYGINAEEAFRFGLPCGGTVALVLETINERSKIGTLLQWLDDGKRCRRTLDLKTGAVVQDTLDSPVNSDTQLTLTDHALITCHGPGLRLLIIGAGQMTHYLAEMALACDYAVTVCDPRAEYHHQWRVERAQLLDTMPDDTVVALQPNTSTAIVALTHDPKLDDLALIEALQSDAFYVGAIGSRRTQQQRKERLKAFGVTDLQLERLHGPVGLKNGARTPPEIAVAILAEMTAERYGLSVPVPTPKFSLNRAHPR